jgi:hypothetical protein
MATAGKPNTATGTRTRTNRRSAPDTKIGLLGVTGPWVLLISLIFVLESLLLLYAVMAFWPPALSIAASADTTTQPDSVVTFFGATIKMSREQNLLLLMAILGALGAMGHVLRSFFKYVGERGLLWSWIPQYFLIPFVGSILATITYILLRAGLIGGSSTGAVPEGNTWGFAAVATLVGLFSAQAAEKLKDVFEIVLSPAQKGGEAVDTAETSITVTPRKGKVGDEVLIRGAGLESASNVTFPGPADAEAKWDAAQQAVVTKVPDDATGTGFLDVAVDAGMITTSEDFTVT